MTETLQKTQRPESWLQPRDFTWKRKSRDWETRKVIEVLVAEEGTPSSTNRRTLFLSKVTPERRPGFLSLSWKLLRPASLPVPPLTFLPGIYCKEERSVVKGVRRTAHLFTWMSSFLPLQSSTKKQQASGRFQTKPTGTQARWTQEPMVYHMTT